MGIEQTKTLISTRSEENANRLLTAGWTLLLVADRCEGEHLRAEYHFIEILTDDKQVIHYACDAYDHYDYSAGRFKTTQQFHPVSAS